MSDAELSHLTKELEKLRSIINTLEVTNDKYIVELKTYERQVGELSRQLASGILRVWMFSKNTITPNCLNIQSSSQLPTKQIF